MAFSYTIPNRESNRVAKMDDETLGSCIIVCKNSRTLVMLNYLILMQLQSLSVREFSFNTETLIKMHVHHTEQMFHRTGSIVPHLFLQGWFPPPPPHPAERRCYEYSRRPPKHVDWSQHSITATFNVRRCVDFAYAFHPWPPHRSLWTGISQWTKSMFN